jgi:hypothetical protein
VVVALIGSKRCNPNLLRFSRATSQFAPTTTSPRTNVKTKLHAPQVLPILVLPAGRIPVRKRDPTPRPSSAYRSPPAALPRAASCRTSERCLLPPSTPLEPTPSVVHPTGRIPREPAEPLLHALCLHAGRSPTALPARPLPPPSTYLRVAHTRSRGCYWSIREHHRDILEAQGLQRAHGRCYPYVAMSSTPDTKALLPPHLVIPHNNYALPPHYVRACENLAPPLVCSPVLLQCRRTSGCSSSSRPTSSR